MRVMSQAEINATLFDEVAQLRSENDRLREAITSIREEASNLLSCHIETPNLARDALRRMRKFVDDIAIKEPSGEDASKTEGGGE